MQYFREEKEYIIGNKLEVSLAFLRTRGTKMLYEKHVFPRVWKTEAYKENEFAGTFLPYRAYVSFSKIIRIYAIEGGSNSTYRSDLTGRRVIWCAGVLYKVQQIGNQHV